MKIRKTLVIMLIGLSGIGAAYAAGDFCEGYRDGYESGYAQTAGGNRPPTLHIQCPVQRAKGEDEKRPDYQIGYDRGFKDGVRDGSR